MISWVSSPLIPLRIMPRQLPQNLETILKQTSRAFYLSLSVLPSAARYPLSLAYLLARAADTVADSEARPGTDRIATLKALQQSLKHPKSPTFGDALAGFEPGHLGERILLQRTEEIYSILGECPAPLREPVVEVVETLIDGMLWDQTLFQEGASPNGLTDEQLERYTFLVAGCVGPFWSSMCGAGNPALDVLSTAHARTVAIEFGKALQWVNILRDIPKDQAEGRFYLPEMASETFPDRFHRGATRALRAFDSALEYPGYFRFYHVRERLAVVMPLVLGLRTLEKLFKSGGPRPRQRIKVSRSEVFLWLGSGPIMSLGAPLLNNVLKHLHTRAQAALNRWSDTHL